MRSAAYLTVLLLALIAATTAPGPILPFVAATVAVLVAGNLPRVRV